ncbi:putative pal1-like protein [Diaporthe ampelina]|uniref:Putative pal1-like protein n=1 Tax=Diaporthe ampelina TaxID=1214573 RepID=A0A0G2FHM5_9PEZI|nr:putative pal1-like protein [Diaporthe ampelina]
MASGWFGSKTIELIRARSLFVNVSPTPTSLSERRAVLHALQRHGPIEVFKRLPSPETFVCAPAKTESATELIKRSPLTFRFVSETLESVEEEAKPGVRAIEVASPVKVHIERDSRGANASVAKAVESQRSDIVKTFTMRINPSQSYYEHKTNIRLSPTHGPWPKADSAQTRREDQDFVFLALKDAVPNTIARAGLCDWHTGGQLSGEPAWMRAQAADARLWHIKERQARKVRNMGKGTQAQLGGDLTAVTSLDALYGSKNEAQREGLSPDPGNGTDADSTQAAGSPAPPPKTPAWVRRRQFQLNPLADGRHSKITKKEGVMGKSFGWKSILNNTQADDTEPSESPTEPLDGKR